MIRAALLTTLCLIGWIGALGWRQTSKNGSSAGKGAPTAPILRIEAGGHTAPVRGVAMDPAGHFLVTVSHDKSARVWELPSLRLIRVLRPPLGLTSNEGKLYAVAISPDGNQVAVGGWTGYEWSGNCAVYIFNLASGKIVRVLRGLPQVIQSLAFSHDGLRVAVGLDTGGGLRVFTAADGSLAFQDASFHDAIYGLDFDRSGRLVACSRDRSVRMYDPRGHVLAQVLRPEGSDPVSVAFSPDGKRVAVGDYAKPSVVILSGATLEPEYPVRTDDLNGPVDSVAWSADGSALYAAGRAWVVGNQKDRGGVREIVRTWPNAGRGSPIDAAVAGDTITALSRLPSGGVAFGAGDGFGTLSASGGVKRVNLPVADPRGLGANFHLSRDGDRVWFAYGSFGNQPVAFSIAARELLPDKPGDAAHSSGAPPKLETGRFKVTDWENNDHPKLNGVALPLEANERSRSLAILPGESGFLLGTEWYLRRFGSDAKESWHVSTLDAARAVNVTGDGRLAVAVFYDGTVRWYRLADGKELLALYAHPDKKRWVLWTPSGYYDCSPGGEDLIGWSVNNGADHEADFYPASRFRSTYYRPDVVARVLSTLDEAQAVALANAASGRAGAPSITALLPPVVRIVSVERGGTVERPTVNVRYAIRTQTADPVKAIDFYAGGRLVKTDGALTLDARQEVVREVSLDAPPDATVVAIQAWNRSPSEFARTEIAALRSGLATPEPSRPAAGIHHLRVLAIGVGKFENEPKLNLRLPAKDARDFSAAMRAQAALYGSPDVNTLCDDSAHKGQILDAFQRLSDECQDGDVAMIYLSGHGMQDKSGDYYFLPCDYETGHAKRSAISFADLYSTVRDLTRHGIVYVFLDTCHASAALSEIPPIDSTGLISSLIEKGAVVVSACEGNESAIERPDWGNGAFTKLILDGLNKGAAVDDHGFISALALIDYVQARMESLNPRQHPTLMQPASTHRLLIARRAAR